MPETAIKTEQKTEVKATISHPFKLYLYQPSGTEDRITDKRDFLYRDSEDKLKKVTIERGVNSISSSAWEGIIQNEYCQDLIESRQLFLVSNTDNLIKDYVRNDGVNGAVRIEDLIDRCFDRTDDGLLVRWRSWIQQQDLTTSSKYGKYLAQINKVLETPKNLNNLPRISNEPLEPNLTGFVGGIGQL